MNISALVVAILLTAGALFAGSMLEYGSRPAHRRSKRDWDRNGTKRLLLILGLSAAAAVVFWGEKL